MKSFIIDWLSTHFDVLTVQLESRYLSIMIEGCTLLDQAYTVTYL